MSFDIKILKKRVTAVDILSLRDLISISNKTLPLKLKTVPQQKKSLTLLLGTTSHENSEVIFSLLFSSKISNNSIYFVQLKLISLNVFTS